jgi:hypothetical protein
VSQECRTRSRTTISDLAFLTVGALPGERGGHRPSKDREIGRYLADLLTHQQAYRSRWERQVLQRPSTTPTQAAIARVVAGYLVEADERRDTVGLHRQLKDRVARAFNREAVSAETLGWIIGAFDMADEHAARLWAMFDGSKKAGFVTGGWPPAGERLVGQGCQTVSLHELHTLGHDGRPVSHRTIQVVRATVDGLTSYLYRFDTNAADVQVIRGGRAGTVRDLGQGLHGVDIAFNAALSVGETVSLEYLTRFRYQQPPPPEFRRAVLRRVDNLEMRVQFHPHRPPAHVWWACWHSLEGAPGERELVQVDDELAVHRYLDGVEQAIVGFLWDWEASR